MCIAKQLLAEKLIDDFYEDAQSAEQEPQNGESLTERLKALLPTELHEIFYRWEAECAENCGRELRRFADFVAGILMTNHRHEEGGGE